MPEDSIVRRFNSADIEQRIADGYINLNQMAKATGKRIDNWTRLQSTKELIAEFDRQITSSDLREQLPALITVTSGIAGQRGGGGTWAHPDIAVQFAQWCSPTFALLVSRWVREWMTSGRSRVSGAYKGSERPTTVAGHKTSCRRSTLGRADKAPTDLAIAD